MNCNLIQYLLLLLFLLTPASALAQREAIRLLNGITRTDVPKMTVSTYRLPSLEKIEDLPTCINVSAELEQLGERYFEAFDTNGNEAYFVLDREYKFQPVDKKTVTSFMDAHKAQYVKQLIGRPVNDKEIDIYENQKLISRFNSPSKHHIPADGSTFYFFNDGKSVGFYDQEHLYVVKDIHHPTIATYKSPGMCFGVFGDPTCKHFYTEQMEDGGNNRIFSFCRFDPFNAAMQPRFAVLSGKEVYNVGQCLYVKDLDRIVCPLNSGNLDIFDGTSGKGILSTKLFSDDRGTARALLKVGGKSVGLIGNKLVDISDGRILGELPGFYPLSSLDQSPDNRYLLYSAESAPHTLSFTKLVLFDLSKLAVGGSITVVGTPASSDLPLPAIRGTYFMPDGTLVVLRGTQVQYMNQEYVPGFQ